MAGGGGDDEVRLVSPMNLGQPPLVSLEKEAVKIMNFLAKFALVVVPLLAIAAALIGVFDSATEPREEARAAFSLVYLTHQGSFQGKSNLIEREAKPLVGGLRGRQGLKSHAVDPLPLPLPLPPLSIGHKKENYK